MKISAFQRELPSKAKNFNCSSFRNRNDLKEMFDSQITLIIQAVKNKISYLKRERPDVVLVCPTLYALLLDI